MNASAMSDRSNPLPSGARLASAISNRKYRIRGKRLRKAGIGFLYRGETVGNKPVSVLIKEYFPVDIAARGQGGKKEEVGPWDAQAQDAFEAYRESFRRAGIAMQRASAEGHEHLLPLVDVFDANGTTYAVWELPPDFDEASEPGGEWAFETLETWGKKRKAPERRKHAPEFLAGLRSALELMREHSAAHLNLKPANIFMFADQPVIADFGLPDWYTEPFAAPEQYKEDMGPDDKAPPACEADEYGLGVTIVNFLLGFEDGQAVNEMESILISAPKRQALERSNPKRPDPLNRWIEGMQSSGLLDADTCEQLLQCLRLNPEKRIAGDAATSVARAFDDPGFHDFPLSLEGEQLRWIAGEHTVFRFDADKKYVGQIQIPGPGIRCCGASSNGNLLVISAVGSAQVWERTAENDYLLTAPSLTLDFASVGAGSEAFEITRTTITVGEYLAAASLEEKGFRRDNRLDAGGDGLPVTNVTFGDVQEFLKTLNECGDGYRYRLPTELEWEAAACVADSAAYPWGDITEEASHRAQFHSEDGPVNADEFAETPNPNGLLNIVGNVWEWTQSGWSENRETITSEPPARAKHLVLRGGGWLSSVEDIRLDSRISGKRGTRYPTVGFRVVRETPPA